MSKLYTALKHEAAWLDKYLFDDAEEAYYAKITGKPAPASRRRSTRSSVRNDDGQSVNVQANEDRFSGSAGESSIISELSRAREQIRLTLEASGSAAVGEASKKLQALELENQGLKQTVADLVSRISKLETRVNSLEGSGDKPKANSVPAKTAAAPAKPAAKPSAQVDDDDDDIDLFGSDGDDEEAAAVRDARVKEYAEKKAKKPGPIAKSSIILDVKPWDDETDMKALENCVRSISMDGLVWGASKFMPVAYNVKKLQIVCVVEDEKVSIEELSEKIEAFEDFVQSVDVAAFNKI
ncbi:Elongation factor 1-delta [Halotydeus destructor]|nr:Elongation factor 1-delta [Halotydeus destructor]